MQCFYKTLYYNLLDENKLDLVLEPSMASLTDSISFEQVTAGGQFMQLYGSTKTVAGTNTYHQLTGTLQAGTTYIRARIKLKSGVSVYTNIIAVLTSGTKKILFYPHPANRNQPLQYMLQQGVAADSQLQLFDISGRMLKHFSSLPASLNLQTIAPGLYIYRLLKQDNTIIESGKLLLQ